MTGVRVVLCTCPDRAVAESLAQQLVQYRLAACVNILPEIRSIYRWENEVQQESEVLMIIKTGEDAFPSLELWLSEHHPYDVPEVLALPIEHGADAYLKWVIQQTDLSAI